MIGGKVIETLILPEQNRVWINTRDYDKTTGEWRSDICAIYVEDSAAARSISEGDVVWWQGNCAHWTAKDRKGRTVGKADVKLVRKSYSGVKRPVVEESSAAATLST